MSGPRTILDIERTKGQKITAERLLCIPTQSDRDEKQTFILRTKGRQHEGELGRQSDWPGIETPDLDGWYYSLSEGYGQEIATKP